MRPSPSLSVAHKSLRMIFFYPYNNYNSRQSFKSEAIENTQASACNRGYITKELQVLDVDD